MDRAPQDRSAAGEVSHLLKAWGGGETRVPDRLFALVYGELRRLAAHYMRGERGDHTLQTTALVHEAYVRLVGADVDWADRAHFFRVAGQAMRRVLVDHARARRAEKRGGHLARVTLAEADLGVHAPRPDIVELDRAIQELARNDPRKASVVELHFFIGLSYEEVARVLGISPVTVHRDLMFARSWLRGALSDASADAE